jgi:propanol-preferring alcohol dehydrogenase
MDGELPKPKLPLVLGHELVGRVVELGPGAERFAVGERVGVPWLGWTCGICPYCGSGRENLCDAARFTGYHIDGGFAQMAVADERFCFAIPDSYSDLEAAPLLCAGLIGYRSLVAAGDARRLGLYGFGAAAHLVAQLAIQQGGRCMPLRVRETKTHSNSLVKLAPFGPTVRTSLLPNRWMPPSCTRRSAR